MWDLCTNKCLDTIQVNMNVESLCLLPSNQLSIGSDDGTIAIWNMENMTKVRSFRGHEDAILCFKSVGPARLFSSSYDKLIKAWDIESRECLFILSKISTFSYSL